MFIQSLVSAKSSSKSTTTALGWVMQVSVTGKGCLVHSMDAADLRIKYCPRPALRINPMPWSRATCDLAMAVFFQCDDSGRRKRAGEIRRQRHPRHVLLRLVGETLSRGTAPSALLHMYRDADDALAVKQTTDMALPKSNPAVLFETRGKIAIITLNQPKKLNALTQDLYFHISQLLRHIDTRDDLFITVLTGKGRFFSAGADVTVSRTAAAEEDIYQRWMHSFVANNINTSKAFYEHKKILITALNGPAVGLSAALIALSDFVYAAPHTFLLTPFSSLGLVSEGLASRSLVQRLGISKANEALIMSKRITCEELVQVGFVNKVFDTQPNDSDKFLELVLEEIDNRLGDHLVNDSMTKIKALIRRPERDLYDSHSIAEAFAGLDRFVNNIPQQEFAKVASGQKRHKL